SASCAAHYAWGRSRITSLHRIVGWQRRQTHLRAPDVPLVDSLPRRTEGVAVAVLHRHVVVRDAGLLGGLLRRGLQFVLELTHGRDRLPHRLVEVLVHHRLHRDRELAGQGAVAAGTAGFVQPVAPMSRGREGSALRASVLVDHGLNLSRGVPHASQGASSGGSGSEVGMSCGMLSSRSPWPDVRTSRMTSRRGRRCSRTSSYAGGGGSMLFTVIATARAITPSSYSLPSAFV